MFLEFIQVLDELAVELSETLEDEPGRDSEIMDELFPELREVCGSLWVLELIVDYCKRRK